MEEKKVIPNGEKSIGAADTEIQPDVSEYFIDPEVEKRVLRKIDMFVMPMMCLVFFTQYLDKQSLSYASVFGLVTDLKMVGTEYSWCSSIFYVGQLVSEYPFIYLMSRLPLAKFVGATIIIWGGICMCLAAPTNFAGFAAVRFLLGFAEGAVSPAFITITSIWYKKEEHPMRVAMWVTCNGLAQVVGSLLMYGIGTSAHITIAPWRAMFIIAGSITCAAGLLFFFLMPANVHTAWFLTPEERIVASKRLAGQHDGGDKVDFSMRQLKEALLDVRTFITFLFGLLVTINSIVLTFASLVIKNLGYSSAKTLLYGSPSGAVQIVFIWLGVLLCYLFPNRRCLIVIALITIPLVGCILLTKLPLSAGWGMIVASWLASVISDIFVILMSLSASNVRGNTKKAVVNAVFFIGYATGCIAGPQLWLTNEAPRYSEGVICSIVAWALLYPVMMWYWWLNTTENKRRDRLQAEMDLGHYIAGEDVTDKEDLTFRYTT